MRSPSIIRQTTRRPGRRIDLREVGRALLLAAVVASVVTGITIETEFLDRSTVDATPDRAAAPSRAQPVVDRDPAAATWTAAPLRGLSPSEIWAADESSHGLRPEAAH